MRAGLVSEQGVLFPAGVAVLGMPQAYAPLKVR
jgi:hypothetical protein